MFSAGTQAANKARVVLWRWPARPCRAVRHRATAALSPGCTARSVPATVPSWPRGGLRLSVSSRPRGTHGEGLLGAVVQQQWSQGVTGSPQHCCLIPGVFAWFGCMVFTAHLWGVFAGVNCSAELWVCQLLFGGRQHVYQYRFTVALLESSELPPP